MSDKNKFGTDPIQPTLAEWEKPEVQRIEARDAETAPSGNPDGGINS
jgi:hypothetical protein